MIVLVLLYIFICHKTGLGLDWFDWVVLALVSCATLTDVVVKKEMRRKLLQESGNEGDGSDSYFKDLFSSKEK